MTFILVLLILHADGTSSLNELPVRSVQECHSLGRAWLASRRDVETPEVADFRCKVREPRR
jgi:hypothetical protein